MTAGSYEYRVAAGLIAVMISVGGILLGIGYSIGDRRLKEYGKEEIYQALVNAAIVGMLLLSVAGYGRIDSLVNGVAGLQPSQQQCDGVGGGNQALCFAYGYLVGTSGVYIDGRPSSSLMSMSESMLVPAGLAYGAVALVSGVTLYFRAGSISFASLLRPAVSQLGYLLAALSAAMVGIELQAIVLRLVDVAAMPVIMPIGLALRSLQPTRKLGGAMIAIAIGLYAVLPLTYVLNARLAGSFIAQSGAEGIGALLSRAQAAQSGVQSAASQNVPFLSPGTVASGISSVFGLSTALSSEMMQLSDYVAAMVVQVFLLPTFSLVLTGVAIREMSQVLGSDVSLGRYI